MSSVVGRTKEMEQLTFRDFVVYNGLRKLLSRGRSNYDTPRVRFALKVLSDSNFPEDEGLDRERLTKYLRQNPRYAQEAHNRKSYESIGADMLTEYHDFLFVVKLYSR